MAEEEELEEEQNPEEEQKQEEEKVSKDDADDLIKKLDKLFDEKFKKSFAHLLESDNVDVTDKGEKSDPDKIREMVRRAVEELKLAETDAKIKGEVKEVMKDVENKVKKIPFLQKIFWGEL
jgi:DUF438 domain-containing protein